MRMCDIQRHHGFLPIDCSSLSPVFLYFRVIKMAVVHDMAEAVVGDITPHCGVSQSDKYTLEKVVLFYLLLSSFVLIYVIYSSVYV